MSAIPSARRWGGKREANRRAGSAALTLSVKETCQLFALKICSQITPERDRAESSWRCEVLLRLKGGLGLLSMYQLATALSVQLAEDNAALGPDFT